MAARDIEEAVGPTFGHAGDVSRNDGKKVENIGHGCTVEVAVGLHATVKGDHGVVNRCGELAAAVRAAYELAGQERRAGAVVLLSPAAASFDQFANFEARGEAFRRLVEALPGRRS